MLLRLGIAGAIMATAVAAQESASDRFEKKIRPVLAQRCYQCHSSSAPAPQGGLLLDSASGIRRGGNSGAVVRPGDPESSQLIRAIRYQDKSLKMPPGGALPPDVVADFETWIREGALLPEDRVLTTKVQFKLWSLTAPARPEPPTVKGRWGRNEIDAFILSKLEAKGLAPSAEADRRTLIRRVSYDLTGLPPSAGDIDAFVQDAAPDAYEKLVDRLLASPRYGERWGRHWLDVARYADSENDSVNSGQRYPWSYTYRDWVIRSFNDDLPYDKFVLYQIAADRVAGIEPRHLAALGFLSLGREFPKSYPETVDDRIDAVSRGFLGLTVACARCHDHKFDPIPTRDYYSLYSILSNIRQPKELPLLGPAGAPSPKEELYQTRLSRIEKELEAYRTRRNDEMVAFFKTQTADYLLAAHDAELMSNTAIEDLVRDRQLNQHVLERWRKYLRSSKSSGESVFRLWHAAAAIPPAQFASRWPSVRDTGNVSGLLHAELSAGRIEALRELAAAYAAALTKHDRVEPFGEPERDALRAVLRGPGAPANVPVDEFELIYTEGDSNNTRSILVRHNAMLAQSAYDGSAPRAMAVEDVPSPAPGHVFIRGNPNNPGAPVSPRFLSCLGGEDKVFRNGSGRLEFAQAIIAPSNPLTARVMVNRVWMHHFGFGLVRTPSDFGFRGDLPTHPELLDYLAVKFVDSGWSLKKLHRLIMTSAAYRQASTDNEAARKIDPENQLLWRMNRRRLEIEAVRDSMLAAAGRLDLTSGGVPFLLTAEPSTPRRSVYGFIERGRVPAVWGAFDFASPDQHAPLRFVTTVPQQALFFLNSPFIAEQSAALAARVETAEASTPSAKIEQMYRLVLGRGPERRESDAALRFVSDGGASLEDKGATSPWLYGTGLFDATGGRVTSFTPFTTFVQDRWQGGASMPAPSGGKAVLRATGGEPGEQRGEVVVRRWVSPISGALTIEGTLRHGQPAVPYGDGVRGRIVSSRHGELASWSVNGSTAETRLGGLKIEKGDTIDFVVDGRLDPENDAFSWTPTIKVGSSAWNAKSDFSGPAPRPLSVWARLGQVLFETNEFSFVD
jgi:hypothetical protein